MIDARSSLIMAQVAFKEACEDARLQNSPNAYAAVPENTVKKFKQLIAACVELGIIEIVEPEPVQAEYFVQGFGFKVPDEGFLS